MGTPELPGGATCYAGDLVEWVLHRLKRSYCKDNTSIDYLTKSPALLCCKDKTKPPLHRVDQGWSPSLCLWSSTPWRPCISGGCSDPTTLAPAHDVSCLTNLISFYDPGWHQEFGSPTNRLTRLEVLSSVFGRPWWDATSNSTLHS